jgi:hypothetical protein
MGESYPKGVSGGAIDLSKMWIQDAHPRLYYPAEGDKKNSATPEKPRHPETRSTHPYTTTSTSTSISMSQWEFPGSSRGDICLQAQHGHPDDSHSL